jgi:hypothetical protein
MGLWRKLKKIFTKQPSYRELHKKPLHLRYPNQTYKEPNRTNQTPGKVALEQLCKDANQRNIKTPKEIDPIPTVPKKPTGLNTIFPQKCTNPKSEFYNVKCGKWCNYFGKCNPYHNQAPTKNQQCNATIKDGITSYSKHNKASEDKLPPHYPD